MKEKRQDVTKEKQQSNVAETDTSTGVTKETAQKTERGFIKENAKCTVAKVKASQNSSTTSQPVSGVAFNGATATVSSTSIPLATVSCDNKQVGSQEE